MKSIGSIALIVVLGVCVPAIAVAGPAKGLGAFLGSATHSNEFGVGGGTQTYDSGGGGIGFDYQMPLGDSSSFNFFYMLFASSNPVTNEFPLDTGDIAEDILGLQYRYWPTESVFVGAHAGIYSQAITFTFFNPESGTGFGVGLIAGGELEVSKTLHLTGSVQYDTASIGVISGADSSKVTGTTILLGLRFVR